MSLEEEITSLIGRKGKDVTPHHISQPRLTAGPVENFLSRFQRVQEETAKSCIEQAEWHESEAEKLRKNAMMLVEQARQIPEDLRNATEFEIKTRTYVNFINGIRQPKE